MRSTWLASIAALALLLGVGRARGQEGEACAHSLTRYTLVQFPADSPELTGANERIIRDHIAEDVTDGAKVTVIGYTDVVGLEDRNRRLSLQRAQNVATTIRRLIPRDRHVSITARGVGEESPLYTNDLPEGRFYNRTVMIVIDARN